MFGLVALFVITSAWWALALWPVADAPDWLARTRLVCFGVRESGLPDAGGWIGLVFGPLGMLTILLAGWWQGFRQLLTRARTSRFVGATMGALVLGVILLLAGAALRVRDARASLPLVAALDELPPPNYPRLDRAAPPLALLGHDGSVVSLAALRGTPVLVTFAYGHCATICPVIVSEVLAAQRALGARGVRTAVFVVTVDPWRDTPSRLASIASTWRLPDSDAWVLGGTVEDVEAALDAWEVPRTRDERTGEVTHPALVYIVDRDGMIAYASTGGAAAMAALVERLGSAAAGESHGGDDDDDAEERADTGQHGSASAGGEHLGAAGRQPGRRGP